MALILSIETSTSVCSVALHEDGNLLAISEVAMDKAHSRNVIPLINSLYAATQKRLEDTDAFAVSMGPGSYTGLRIGVSTAKGLCYATDKPLIAVNTLEAMAIEMAAHYPKDVLFCPMIDARRMEVYTALYDDKGVLHLPTAAVVLDNESFKNLSQAEVVCFGSGAAKFRDLVSERRNFKFVDNVYPSAKGVGKLAFRNFQAKQFVDVAYFEPFYLKEFVSTGNKK